MTALLLLCLLDPSPVPTLRWDPTERAEGYRVYSREVGGEWRRGRDLPCWTEEDGARRCPGADLDVPVWRAALPWALVPGVEYDFVVKAYNAAGESAEFSNPVSVCWPQM